MIKTTPQDILDFWFSPPMNRHWFEPDTGLDNTIRARYVQVWQEAAACVPTTMMKTTQEADSLVGELMKLVAIL